MKLRLFFLITIFQLNSIFSQITLIPDSKFEEELIHAQQEIQEETLKHVGRELHDNVGQLLAFATMQ